MGNNPLVSVIIPARNASSYIGKCIESLKKLDYPNYELIIVNDGSCDSTKDILSGFKDIKVLETTGIGPSAARNLAIKESKGEYVAFTDADCIVHPQWLNELLKGFNSGLMAQDSGPVVSTGGDQQSPQDETVFGRMVQDFLKIVGFTADYVKNSDVIKKTKHNPTCNVMYIKKVLTDIGGFLEGLWPGEDLDIDYRLAKKGYEFNFNPKAVVYHYRPDSFKKFVRMMFNYGRAQSFLVKTYGLFRFIHYIPLILFAFIGFCISIKLKSFVLLCSIILLTVYIYFTYKTKDLFKSLKFLFMLVITVIFWNIGFMQELILDRYKIKGKTV
ncbi:MAG: glycosyltransferase [Elusimicrobia bacterium]|nr:glycosyltransferase [Candidatus Liberimonas magnetica]